MSEFYDRLADTADRLLKKFGTDCKITTTPVSGEFDPVTGMPGDDLPSQIFDGTLAVLNYKESLYNAPESLIQIGDKKLLLSAKGITIDSLNGRIEALGKAYRIMSVKDVNPAGVVLIYEIHGRI